MYVIVVYDVEAKRTVKMLKHFRRYLNWIQNSVFEGEIEAVQLNKMLYEAERLMEDDDSLIIFKSRDERWLEKKVIGKEKKSISNLI